MTEDITYADVHKHLEEGDKALGQAAALAHRRDEQGTSEYFSNALLEYGRAAREARALGGDSIQRVEAHRKEALGRMENLLGKHFDSNTKIVRRIHTINTGRVAITEGAHAAAVVLIVVSLISMGISYIRFTGAVIGTVASSTITFGAIAIVTALIALVILLRKR